MGKRTNTAKWMENQHRWQINVQKDGVRRSFTSSKPGRTGQREANAKADAWLDDGIMSMSKRVRDVWPKFIDDLKSRTSIGNWRPINGIGDNWVIPNIGNIKIQSLNDQHLQSVINKANQENKSKKTISNIRAAMVSFVKFCRKSKLCTYVPEDIIIPTSAPKKEKNILQPEELKVLLQAAKTDEEAAAYALQVLTGLRPGELLALKKSDRHGDVLHIQRSINEYNEITSGKNDNAKRSVYLVSAAKNAWDLIISKTEGVDLFPHISQKIYRNHLVKFCKEHNFPYTVTPYGLRHTFVSLAKTLPAGLVKEQVGHSSNMDTFGVYGHFVNTDQEHLGIALETVFSTIEK